MARAIDYRVDGNVARLTLDRPASGNGIDLHLARELHEATLECAHDRAVRAVLLTGAGRSFCVGGDLASFTTLGDGLPNHLREVTTYLHAAVARLARLRAPVVVAVQGSAAGAGMSLACGGDLVVVGPSTRFVLAYTRIGLSPDGGASWFLPRLVGLRRSLELALTNRPIAGEEAVAWGLATMLVDDGEILSTAERIATELAAGPTGAYGATKRLLRDSLDNQLESQLELEAIALATNAAAPDGHEGMAAFLEKRPPRYTGVTGP
jgi:2-(1,2-epoxy-1,2-dihydrophenyl)acetyl-CoA isomerase